ncbi:putative d-amino acid [Phaeomoniella chlamydospora]|uniref:Putative d-amino acid n=1 Tax=Phaeomoniella chlamydospora TaxID=158046 RepID=A0A0G2DYV2_PHACM|nr:putative d-amino acid [Phaeomoniella chlamydospora]
MASTQETDHIVVLGAGVIGLQTALTLLSHGYRVTIVSSSWPGALDDPHYTSMFSGAQWRSNPALTDQQQIAWDRTTLLHWRDLIANAAANSTGSSLGLEVRQAKFFWDSLPTHPPSQEHWWSSNEPFVPICVIEPEDCIKRGFKAGFAYETVAVNPILYCSWLLQQCEAHNVQKRTLRLGNLQTAFEERVTGTREAHAVVNCAGLDAGILVGDETCFPTGGQTVLVRGQAHQIVTRRNELSGDPWEALVIPRPGENVTMLGGCKRAGNWNTEPDNEITETILERCKLLAPELLNEKGNFDIVAVRVGLRPSRKGGPRVEVEELENGKFAVHNYGHHSAGFEGSVGAAEAVAKLIANRLEK